MIDPARVTIRGLPLDGLWRLPDGRRVAVMAGGAPDEGEGEGEGEGKGGEGEGKPEGKGDDPAAEARREAAALRKRLRETERERDELKSAQQTDAERLAARAEAAEGTATQVTARLRAANLRLAVLEQGREVGITDPRLAAKLLDDDAVSYDDENEPDREALTGALRKLATEYPTLTRGGDADAGRRGTSAEPTGKDGINAWLRGEKAAAG